MAISFQKNFLKDFYFDFLKKFLAHIAKTESSVVFIEWKVKTQRAKNTWTSPHAENKIWKELTQPLNTQPKLITQEDLHKLASKTVGNAKKIYLHYTPQEGAMVVKFLF